MILTIRQPSDRKSRPGKDGFRSRYADWSGLLAHDPHEDVAVEGDVFEVEFLFFVFLAGEGGFELPLAAGAEALNPRCSTASPTWPPASPWTE